MDWQVFLISLAVMAGLGATLSAVLSLANQKLYVYEDPRINQVEGMLPSTNCGACGQPGCRAFAESVVQGQNTPGNCTVSSEENREAIAEYLGVSVGGEEKRVARLACAGGTHVARQRARYVGLQTCQGANLVSGGGKGCAWGCLGLADCQRVCDFDAITMNEYALPVVDESLCTACGDCVEVCPKHLFSLQPLSHRLWVACKNEALGEEAEAECLVACNGCARCVADSPSGVLRMVNNLPVVDYNRNFETNPAAIQRCPTGAIVWLQPNREITKGKMARRIVRHSPLPLG